MDKFFPPIITNHLGFEEDSFQYVLRHTQLRPRQVIWICNSIAQACHERKAFPSISNNDVLKGVATVEETLASEVLNSFQSVYPRARNILASFRGQSNFMRQASYLDKLASRTKAVWDENHMPYDRNTFMQMCCEMGIIGSVVDKTDKVIKAEFEYTLTDRLYLNYNEECVIHPMFYKYFRISPLTDRIVYPIGPDTE